MIQRDYRLHELNADEFEQLVIRICLNWLGQGVSPFAAGKDGGRDGKFKGKANCFPSTTSPLEGHFVIQAKHTASPNKSCSDNDFERLLAFEHPKISRLLTEGICEHYIVFTNRKYTGGADEKLTKALMDLGLNSANIIGQEKLKLALDEYADIRHSLPNRFDASPFRFDPDDLVEVIGALNDFVHDDTDSTFNSAHDFDKLKIQEKNIINDVSDEYYNQVIVGSSMPHFERVNQFLQNPRNSEYADLYHDAADELKQKIIIKRNEFKSFDDVFMFLREGVQKKKEALKGKKRLITILLHYMYCNCDIGSKMAIYGGAQVDVDA